MNPERPGAWARLATCLVLVVCLATVALGQRRLAVGDRIRLNAPDEPSVSRDYAIEATGTVRLEPFAPVVVAGLPVEEAVARILASLREQGLALADGLTGQVLVRDDLPIRFSGAVEKPGEVWLTEGMRLGDLVRLARPSEACDLGKIEIVAQTGETLVVDYERAQMGEPGHDPELRAGDDVRFPVSTRVREVFAFGAVARPGAIRFVRGMSVADLIAGAGGLTSVGRTDGVEVSRGDRTVARLNHPTETVAFALEPGDVVRVAMAERRSFVGVDGMVRRPSILDLEDAPTLLKAVNAVGGALEKGDLSRVVLIRINGAQQVRTTHDLQTIMRGLAADVPLKAGDTVLVPEGKPGVVRMQLDELLRRFRWPGGRP
ncbi:MAG: SLBB domain-containing protein [Fimbriimonadaceae bacterium]|nr:SLBB domain-containing protein [Fimbriimonadaceae bacterium]